MISGDGPNVNDDKLPVTVLRLDNQREFRYACIIFRSIGLL